MKKHPFTNVSTQTNSCDWCQKADYHPDHNVDPMGAEQALFIGMLLGCIMRMNADADVTMVQDVRPTVDDLGNYTNVIVVTLANGTQYRVTVTPHSEDE